MGRWAHKAFALALLLFGASEASADLVVRDRQLHFRTGWFYADLSTDVVTLNQTISVASLDIEYEHITGASRSYLIRTTLASDINPTRMRYLSVAAGTRVYLFSRGAAIEGYEGGSKIVQIPKLRFYAGGDGGIAFASIRQIGLVNEANAALIEVKANAGAIYQVNPSFGVELQLGGGVGVSFTHISATGPIITATGGLSYFF